MKVFRYTALDLEGRRRAGLGYADDAPRLRDQLVEANLHPISIRTAVLSRGRRMGLTDADAARLAKDMAQLIGSGLSLTQALSLIVTRETPRVSTIAREIRSRVSGGEPLSSAFQAADGQPARFLQALARAGEASGRQADVLAAGSASLAAVAQLKQRLITLSVYPAFVILVAFGSIAVYAYAVLPSLEPAFASLGDDIPLQTQAVLTFGAVVRVAFPLLAGILMAVLVALGASPRLQSLARDLAASLLMRGRRGPLRDFVFAGLGSRLAVMLQAGVPLATAWRLAREPISLARLSRQLEAQDTRLMEGASLATALGAVPACPADLLHYVALGEQSGTLPKALLEAASSLGKRAQHTIERILAILTPLVIVAVGGLVGLITMMVFQGLLAVGDAVG